MFFRKGGITENLRPPVCNKEKNKERKNNNNSNKNQKKLHINQTPFDLECPFLYLIYFLFKISWLPLWTGSKTESFNLRIACIFFRLILVFNNFIFNLACAVNFSFYLIVLLIVKLLIEANTITLICLLRAAFRHLAPWSTISWRTRWCNATKNKLTVLTRGIIAYNFTLVALNPNNNQLQFDFLAW